MGDSVAEVPDFVWRGILALLIKLVWPTIIALAIIGGLVVLALYKGRKLSFMGGGKDKDSVKERRAQDPMVHELVEIVRINTSAIQAFVSQGQDHKSICLATCGTMEAVGKTLSAMNERLLGIAADAREAANHRRGI